MDVFIFLEKNACINVLFYFQRLSHLLSAMWCGWLHIRALKCKYIELYHSLAKLYFNKSVAYSRKYCAIITARSELQIFGAASLCFFVSVWNISGTAVQICAKFTPKTCLVLARTSLKVKSKVKGQGHQKQKNSIFRPFRPACGLCLAKHFSPLVLHIFNPITGT